MRRLVLAGACVGVMAFTAGANAADLPAYEPAPQVAAPVPSFSWTGPYIGLQAGYGWGDFARGKPKGAVLGGYAGYNVQLDNSPLVFGVETDLNWSDANDKSGGAKVDQRWNGATRARVGAAFDRFLVYGAAGVAYANTKVRVSGVGKDDKTNVGWTVGGGAEYAVTDNVSLRGDYRYADYGKDTYNLGGAKAKASYTEHRLMGGVAYKFGW